MRVRFTPLSSPAVRQLLGGAGGALVALAVYGVAQLFPAAPSLHASAENHAASQAQMLDRIAATTRRLLEEQGVPLAQASEDVR